MVNANDVLISKSSKKSGQGMNAKLGRECDDHRSSDCKNSLLYNFWELWERGITKDITGLLIMSYIAFNLMLEVKYKHF